VIARPKTAMRSKVTIKVAAKSNDQQSLTKASTAVQLRRTSVGDSQPSKSTLFVNPSETVEPSEIKKPIIVDRPYSSANFYGNPED
jgi:hypothetical protein